MSSDGRVPLDRPYLDYTEIQTRAPVRARTWSDMAALAHWVAGRGTMLVPQHRSMVGLSAAGTASNTFQFAVRPQGRAIARVWVFEVRGRPGFPALVTFEPIGAGGPVSPEYPVEPEAFGTRMAPIVIIEGAGVNDQISPSTADTVASCEVVCTAGQCLIVSCAVWEMPRAALAPSAEAFGELGISRDTLYPRRPVEVRDYASVSGVRDLTTSLCVNTSARSRSRSGHISRWGPYIEVTSSSATSITVADYRIVPGLDRPTDTTATLTANMYGLEGGGGAGDWRVVCGSSGATAWVPFGALAAWTAGVTFSAKCEDPTTSNGLRGGSADTVRFEMRVTGGGWVRAYGWAVFE